MKNVICDQKEAIGMTQVGDVRILLLFIVQKHRVHERAVSHQQCITSPTK